MPNVLPTEIYSCIIDRADRRDLSTLSLVCSIFRELAQERLFKDITITDLSRDHALEQLNHLGTTDLRTHLTRKTKSLTVNTLALLDEDDYEQLRTFIFNQEYGRYILMEAYHASRLSIAFADLIRVCSGSLERLTLKHDHRVGHGASIVNYLFDGYFMNNGVFTGLLSHFDIPRLRELEFSTMDTRALFSFSDLQNRIEEPIRTTKANTTTTITRIPLLKRNLQRINTLRFVNCSEERDDEAENTGGSWAFFEDVVPYMPLTVFTWENNRAPLHLNLLQSSTHAQLVHLHIHGALVDKNLLHLLIRNNRRLKYIHLRALEIRAEDADEGVEFVWADVFDVLKTFKNMQYLYLGELRFVKYRSRAEESYMNLDVRDEAYGGLGDYILCMLCSMWERDRVALVELLTMLPTVAEVGYQIDLGNICVKSAQWHEKGECRCPEM